MNFIKPPKEYYCMTVRSDIAEDALYEIQSDLYNSLTSLSEFLKKITTVYLLINLQIYIQFL